MRRNCYKYLMLVISLLLSSAPLFAFQEGRGTIRGTITTSGHAPAGFVTVVLKNTKKVAFTGEDGTFTMRNVPAGNYEIAVSLVGHVTRSRAVTVTAGGTARVDLQLEISDQQLQEVVVNGRNNRFANKETEGIARLPIKNIENPQVYSVIGKDLIKEQVTTDVAEAFRNIPGVMTMKAGGGSAGAMSRGFSTFANVRNGLNTGAIGPEDPVNLERIEAIKGPSATLFGSLKPSYGGVLNYITKKPFETFRGEVAFTGGSWELSRITADINTPLNAEKTVLVRTTASFQAENSFQDRGYARSYSFAPSIVYKASERLTFSLEYERVGQKWSAPPLSWVIGPNVKAKSFAEVELPHGRNIIGNSVYNQNTINSVFAHAQYRISDKWTSNTHYAVSEGYYDRFQYIVFSWQTDSTLARQISFFMPDKFGNTQLQQNFNGDFKIGSFRNRMVIGLDYSRDYSRLNRTPYAQYNYDTVNMRGAIPTIDVTALDAWGAKLPWTATRSIRNVYSAYVSDVVDLTPNLLVMLSLRLDHNVNEGNYNANTGKTSGAYEQTTLSPKFGIVYQPVKDKVALFANYMNGFQNLPPTVQTPGGTPEPLKPQRANQLEGGVKLELFDGKLSSTLSYYDIQVENSTYLRPDNPAVTIQDGTQRSKGFEVEVIANPLPGLNIVAGYGNNENRFTKASLAVEGKLATWAPEHIGNLWISYRLVNGPAKGLGFGAGGNYVGDSWFDTGNTFTLPGYTLVNATVFYDHARYSLNLKLNNLLNEEYWNTNTMAQKTRNIAASVALKF
ncbi:TonB-dependent receptor [Chitinophaga alhagiae]|nr:TonB-dependent receptor [Chitinophaga alhagiae]